MSRSQLRRTILESEVLVVDGNTVEIAGVQYHRAGASEAASLLASATDLANTYAREHGVEEAARPEEIKGVIERLVWKLAAARRHATEQERADGR